MEDDWFLCIMCCRYRVSVAHQLVSQAPKVLLSFIFQQSNSVAAEILGKHPDRDNTSLLGLG